MTKKEFREKKEQILASMANAEGDELKALREQLSSLTIEFNAETAELNREERQVEMTANQQLREAIKQVRSHQHDGTFVLKRDSQNTITSSVISSGDLNNMASAGIPLTIKDLINPLEMDLIYDKLGIKVATNVRGQIQWPCLDSYIEATVGGELADAGAATLDFSKITPTPVKVGVSVEVSNEAINDESFDLVGTIIAQMNKGVGRTLNKRILYLSTTLPTKPEFVGPLMKKNSGGTAMEAAAQTYSFTGDSNSTDFTTKEPTYKDLKKMKGKALKTGASMVGFCYIMDAATFSFLEAQPKDTGSGRFCIEGGKIDGDPVFVVDSTDYAKKIVAGCFAYVALNGHGAANFVVDPYTKAKKNVVVFTLNVDFSLTNLISAANTKGLPFVIGS